MLDCGDLGAESTGRCVTSSQGLAPHNIRTPLKEARRQGEAQTSQEAEIDDGLPASKRAQVSVPAGRVGSPLRRKRPVASRIELEPDDSDRQLDRGYDSFICIGDERANRDKDSVGNGNSNNSSHYLEVMRDASKSFPLASDRVKTTTSAHRAYTDRKQDDAELLERSAESKHRYRPQKFCSVCGDKAIACNFNAVTCESCKAFFRRNAFKEQRLRCLFENRCVIDRITRRFCSKCRLLKCLSIGMKREWILTDEQKQMKRVKIMENKQTRLQQVASARVSSSGNSSCSEETPEACADSRGQYGSRAGQELRADPQTPPAKRDVETRDASVSCPDESDLAAGLVPVQCSFSHRCQFCSLRLSSGPVAMITSHHQSRQQVVGPGFQNRALQSQDQQRRHVHYQHPELTVHGHLMQPNQARPQLPVQPQPLAISTSAPGYSLGSAAKTATATATHRPSMPLQAAPHSLGAQSSCGGGAITSSPSIPQTASTNVYGRYCSEAVSSASARVPAYQIEAPTSTESVGVCGGGGQLAQAPSEIAGGAPHLHELQTSQPRAESSSFCLGQPEPDASIDQGWASCGAATAGAPAGGTQIVVDCIDRGRNVSANDSDALAPAQSIEQSAQIEASKSIMSTQLIEWRGELFVEPAASEHEARARLDRLAELGQPDKQLIVEMLAAVKQVLGNVEKPANNSAHDDLVFFLDVALRSLIKSVKKIQAFRALSMDDQILLMKNACFKILLIRSCFYYNEQIEGWIDRFGNVKYLISLKSDTCESYQRHKELLAKMTQPLRRDRLIISFLIMVVLFDPAASGLKSVSSVELDNLTYMRTLRKYVLATQPDPLAKFELLVDVLRALHICNDEYNLFLSRTYQPEQMTPLLIEIFDIPVNSPNSTPGR